MGTWCQDKKGQVQRMFTRQIFRNKAYLAITIMLARGTNFTLSELETYRSRAANRYTESLVLNERTGEAMEHSKTGKLKVNGVSGYIAEVAEENGYSADLIRLAVYDSYSNISKGFITPEMSLLYSIKKS